VDPTQSVPQAEVAGVAVAPQAARDAFIFIPGLYHDRGEADDVAARRLARAFDQNAQTGSARFSIEDAKEEDFKSTQRTRVVTIQRQDGDVHTPIADVYELNYPRIMTRAFRERKPALQALNIGWLLIVNFGRLLRSIRAPSKTAAEKLQVLYGGFLFLLLAAYVPVLLVGVVGTGWQAVQTVASKSAATGATNPATVATPAAAAPAQPRAPTRNLPFLQWIQFIVVFAAAIGLFTKASLKEFLTETAAHAVPALGYLDYDQRKGLVLGQLNALLDHLEEKAGTISYNNVHVISYSFGSIVALDALFPLQQPSPRLHRVTTLTTIGSPFDFMRTYWPGYFTLRKSIAGKPERWINIYSPMDIMGSDFRDVNANKPERGVILAEGRERRPDVTVLYGRDQTLSLRRPLEYFALTGFRAHALYWEKKEEGGVDCFDDIVRQLYENQPALA
jgi:hypothetical protein